MSDREAGSEGESTCPGVPWKDPENLSRANAASGSSHEYVYTTIFDFPQGHRFLAGACRADPNFSAC